MNDLLTQSFRSRDEPYPPADLESGTEMTSFGAEKNLSLFFQEVGIIKSEMERTKELLAKLQEANEESKSITSAQAMKVLRDRMDRDIAEVLKKAKFIKAKLEALDKENEKNRAIIGCEPGSSIDRTRMSMTNSLRKSLKGLMGEFQTLREKITGEYKETVERRYYTVTGQNADDETIDRMIETGESETFLQRAVREQGRGQVIETIKEIKERHDAVKDIEKNLLELHQVFMDMAVLVEAQGEQLDNIEASVRGASSFVKRGNDQLYTAKKLQRSSRKCMCYAIILLLILILIVVVPIAVKFAKSSSTTTTTSS